MADIAGIANQLSEDSKRIHLKTTVNPAEINSKVLKYLQKTGGYQNQSSAQYQYPSAYIPPDAYQSQYQCNYNWQQPNVQNAYAQQTNVPPQTHTITASNPIQAMAAENVQTPAPKLETAV